MNINSPIIELDLHNLTTDQAIAKIENTIKTAPSSTYRIKAIHGFNSGTRIRQAIQDEYRTGYWDDRVKRITPGDNLGVTDIVLREY